MKTKISALIDDELESHELQGVVAALRDNPEAIDTWRIYHLVGDAMRSTGPLSAGFNERFSRRLAEEPIVVAPRRLERNPARARWVALSAAASVAAVALVGWVAFAPVPGGGGLVSEQGTLAQTRQQPAGVSDSSRNPVARVAKAPARSPARTLPGSARDYLLAHQAYSPRATVQGITPNVQTVSETAAVRDTQ